VGLAFVNASKAIKGKIVVHTIEFHIFDQLLAHGKG
jgi:hypothetical protein